MATKKQQLQKKKMRDAKKKKAAQDKLVAARNADPSERSDDRSRNVTRNQFGGKSMASQRTAQGGSQMHRPQGG